MHPQPTTDDSGGRGASSLGGWPLPNYSPQAGLNGSAPRLLCRVRRMRARKEAGLQPSIARNLLPRALGVRIVEAWKCARRWCDWVGTLLRLRLYALQDLPGLTSGSHNVCKVLVQSEGPTCVNDKMSTEWTLQFGASIPLTISNLQNKLYPF